MSVIKTFNKSIVDLTNQQETHLHASYNSLIDFLEGFNLINSQKDKILEKTFNSQDFVSPKVFAFNTKVMEMYEAASLDQNLSLTQDIEPIVELSLNITADEMYPNQDIDNIIDCLTLKVSSQPWIFSPNHNISCESLSQTLYPVKDISDTDLNERLNNNLDIDQEKTFNDKYENKQLNLVTDISDTDLNERLNNNLEIDQEKTFNDKYENKQLNPVTDISDTEFNHAFNNNIDIDQEKKQVSKTDSIDSYSQDYIIYECTRCDFSFSPEINIKKYEALSNAINGQIYKEVTLHHFNESDTLEIDLYPEKLGKIKIKCNIDNDDKMILQVSAEKLTTLGLLQQNFSELQDIIGKNFLDSSNDKTELSFTMSDNGNNQDRKDFYQKQDTDNEIIFNKTVYFLHNGIINLIV
jgi:flagellar hook-length control protein FliK